MTYLVTILIVLAVFAAWIGVQHIARAFAEKHPEFGPARDGSHGCGFFCLCKDPEECPKKRLSKKTGNEKHPD